MGVVDKFVQGFAGVVDRDLTICLQAGVAYQTDMAAQRVPYDAEYLAKCQAYADSDIAKAVNAGRCALLLRHLAAEASVLDIGAGSGAFVRAAVSWGFAAKGFDVIPETAKQLRAEGLFADDAVEFEAVTLWDVLEHIEDPADVLRTVRAGALLFVSVPIFSDLHAVRESKHYRPGEHLYNWAAPGLVDWMRLHGFKLLEQSDHETAAGRDSIGAFAFKKVRQTCLCGDMPTVENFDWPKKPRAWYVKCHACTAVGPMADTAALADQAWNEATNKRAVPCSQAS